MSQRSIEVKVGALILVALTILGAFMVIMGGLSFEPTYTIYVDFENPGGLQTGAPVKVSGVKVGSIEEMQFRGGVVDEKTGNPVAPIRLVAAIEKRYQKALPENSRFFVTSQGVLGEMFLAIQPGSKDKPPLQDGAVVSGVSPPRLDLLLSESYELLHKAYVAINNNEDEIEETFDGLRHTLKGTGTFFKNNQEKIDNIVTNVETLSEEANTTLKGAREQYIDNPQIKRIFNNVERTSNTVDQNLGPLMKDGRLVLADAKKLTGALASDGQIQRYKKITKDVSATTASARRAAADAEALTRHVRRGKGTVGALLMDEALYDDLQEMLRDLKHNPWKFFWRE